jgi:glycosyltransferase involved in cell wall biosynthesis
MTWHVLDIGSIWIKEFTSALTESVPTLGWNRRMKSWVPRLSVGCLKSLQDPALNFIDFDLQRGYYRFPICQLIGFGRKLSSAIQRLSTDPGSSPLICTSAFYAAVAEKWRGPLVYYLTDFTPKYTDMNLSLVRSLDARICRRADAVFPNSVRIGRYLVEEAGCDPAKITVVPNATRTDNVSDSPLFGPAPLPSDVAHLQRPVAGVLGNLSHNMDWVLLREAIARTPWLTWVFVGPTHMPIPDERAGLAREQVMAAGKRVFFAGEKHYGALQSYARAFDVAILPYKKKEPTFSGSATRFYEHLAACRPIISTPAVFELHDKEPLLSLAATADELVFQLETLKAQQFADGFEVLRWNSSRTETWGHRAAVIRDSVASLVSVAGADLAEITVPL